MSAAKRKGRAWETAIVRYLAEEGIPARHVAQTGQSDAGDVHGVSPFVIQAKDRKDVLNGLREGLDGVQRQAAVAGEPFGVVVSKRARKPVGEAYVAMRLETFRALLVALRERAPSR